MTAEIPAIQSLADLPEREVFPGFRGRMAHSDHMTFAYWTIAPGSALPPHSHPHEQVVNMLAGSFELTVEGVTRTLRAGDVAAIPGGALHGGRALTEVRVLDVFCPVREDYRALDAADAP